jgi:hypothetical protein
MSYNVSEVSGPLAVDGLAHMRPLEAYHSEVSSEGIQKQFAAVDLRSL